MRSFRDIKKDMKYPSIEVKTRCLNEVARYIRDAYNCGIYSEVLGKLFSSKYYFGIDSNELMELISDKYKCKEICDMAGLFKKTYSEKYGVPDDIAFNISADLKYKFICEYVIGKKLDYNNLTCEDIDNFVKEA